MGKWESLSAAEIRGSIPADEAVFYESEAADEIARLASLKNIAGVASVSSSLSFTGLARIFTALRRDGCPEPRSLWLAANFECPAEYEALSFVAPMENKTVLQLGGKGTEAVKLMLAGAKEAWLVSPSSRSSDVVRSWRDSVVWWCRASSERLSESLLAITCSMLSIPQVARTTSKLPRLFQRSPAYFLLVGALRPLSHGGHHSILSAPRFWGNERRKLTVAPSRGKESIVSPKVSVFMMSVCTGLYRAIR